MTDVFGYPAQLPQQLYANRSSLFISVLPFAPSSVRLHHVGRVVINAGDSANPAASVCVSTRIYAYVLISWHFSLHGVSLSAPEQ